ncbi:MAG: hypothetical protein CMB11_07690 [Euryarchaeota archaeon]|nr:hypothetical protein [Euryarchaeota archaeon]
MGKLGRCEVTTRSMLPWSVKPDKPKAKVGPAVSAAEEERKAREAEETDQLIDIILAACLSKDEARRRDTWVTMPLPFESAPPKVTEQARRVAWAKHGLAPPAHRRRFDVYGNALT